MLAVREAQIRMSTAAHFFFCVGFWVRANPYYPCSGLLPSVCACVSVLWLILFSFKKFPPGNNIVRLPRASFPFFVLLTRTNGRNRKRCSDLARLSRRALVRAAETRAGYWEWQVEVSGEWCDLTLGGGHGVGGWDCRLNRTVMQLNLCCRAHKNPGNRSPCSATGSSSATTRRWMEYRE